MQLHGVDIYIRCETIPELPKKFQDFELKIISNKGTRVYPPPIPDIELVDYYRCRYLSEHEVSSEKVETLITYLTEQGFVWIQCIKLYFNNGEEQFSQPY